MSFVQIDTQMVELYLRLRPGQGESALHRGWAAIFIGEFQCLLAIRSHEGGKNNASSGPGRDANRSPEAEYRIQHGANRIGKRAAIDDRYGPAHIVTAPDKARAVRLI